MEEPKPSPSLPNPVSSPHTLPPNTSKRPLDADLQTGHSKIRAVVRDLRLHFLEVLRTPDFRNCKAAHEIREKIKLLLEVQQQVRESVGKNKIEVENQVNPQADDQHLYAKKTEPSQKMKVSAAKPSDNRIPCDGQIAGTFVVGGSAFGWNFITYPGNDAVYYGVKKEVFRATMKDIAWANPKE